MTKKLSDIKILLLQIRNDERVREEEHTSFYRYSGLAPEQLDILNAFDEPDFAPEAVLGYDALYIGGASEASVSNIEAYPFVENGMEMVRFCLEKDIPVFASCFGFQLAVQAMGATLTKDTENFEMGTVLISTTTTAKQDLLFHDTPEEFWAVSVHQEYTKELPNNCELLAYTGHCAHAFKVHHKRFWGFQFHPEVDRDILVERLGIYKHVYTESEEHYQAVIASCHDTPESHAFLDKFIQRVVLGS